MRVQELWTLDSGEENHDQQYSWPLFGSCWDVRQTMCVGVNPTCTSPLPLAIVVTRPWGDS